MCSSIEMRHHLRFNREPAPCMLIQSNFVQVVTNVRHCALYANFKHLFVLIYHGPPFNLSILITFFSFNLSMLMTFF